MAVQHMVIAAAVTVFFAAGAAVAYRRRTGRDTCCPPAEGHAERIRRGHPADKEDLYHH
ncbi:hypothetical protein [Streptomyces chiangmaiensis]|uniref:FeoB-associated Cys-rich membrane protein n=1 Tax=Streptomyces chiangmaiensis TaxID=766497 RepID=A0ABU7F9V1_9ACTN|nr:hypothetical protein [Streptomyces chiangmaiensis]MED7820741.1 hypothetical protein [Streptomyces chiangmaiensis]